MVTCWDCRYVTVYVLIFECVCGVYFLYLYIYLWKSLIQVRHIWIHCGVPFQLTEIQVTDVLRKQMSWPSYNVPYFVSWLRFNGGVVSQLKVLHVALGARIPKTWYRFFLTTPLGERLMNLRAGFTDTFPNKLPKHYHSGSYMESCWLWSDAEEDKYARWL